MRWGVCLLPPTAHIVSELTPGLSDLNGINAAALYLVWPGFLVGGSAFTVAQFAAARWLCAKMAVRSRLVFAAVSLAVVTATGLPFMNWRVLVIVVLAALPAAILLAPRCEMAATPAS